MKIRSPFDGLRVPTELVCEFFGVFSRFEFALKEMGLLIPKARRAEPDWCRFEGEAAKWLAVEPGSNLDAAITYLNEAPPYVQMRDDGWQPRPLCGNTATARALDAVRRVRNNLFHGGKHTPHSPARRDEKLVRCALAVLMACLEQDGELRARFEQTSS